MNVEKENEYALKIIGTLSEMLVNGEGENAIDGDDLAEGENATHFLHALLNIAPAYFYEKLSGEAVDLLTLNHIANRLIFQYLKK